jgi:hypothetical protein
MEDRDIWQQFTTLPPEAQALVADFITFLKQRYNQSQPSQQQKHKDLRSEPFIGLWQDREDMQDSTQWVRATRSSEWQT